MMSATRTLPDDYRQTAEIDLAKNIGLVILLNLAGTVLFVLSLVLLGWLMRWVHPKITAGTLPFLLGLPELLSWLVSIPLIVIVHELIHGFFFWVFTRHQPVFALRLLYAYAAAPDWFIPARQYWIVGLAPLVILDAVGLLFILMAPTGWIPVLSAFLVALNTAGAIGDIFIVARLLQLSPGSLVKDVGDGIRFFERA
jgi:hypothetical protein